MSKVAIVNKQAHEQQPAAEMSKWQKTACVIALFIGAGFITGSVFTFTHALPKLSMREGGIFALAAGGCAGGAGLYMIGRAAHQILRPSETQEENAERLKKTFKYGLMAGFSFLTGMIKGLEQVCIGYEQG